MTASLSPPAVSSGDSSIVAIVLSASLPRLGIGSKTWSPGGRRKAEGEATQQLPKRSPWGPPPHLGPTSDIPGPISGIEPLSTSSALYDSSLTSHSSSSSGLVQLSSNRALVATEQCIARLPLRASHIPCRELKGSYLRPADLAWIFGRGHPHPLLNIKADFPWRKVLVRRSLLPDRGRSFLSS